MTMRNNGTKGTLIAFVVAILAGISGFVVGERRAKNKKKTGKKFSLNPMSTKRPLHHHIIDFLIPHERNSYKPHIFRGRSTTHILLVIALVKVGLLAILFSVYPNLARLDTNVRSEIYTLINNYRSEQSVAPLTVNTYLEQAAMQKASDMLANNYFSHYGANGKKPWEWLDKDQYSFVAMGENLAMDFLTAGSVFKAFQISPAHDRNLLQKNYSEIGIAVTNGYLNGHNTNVMVVFFAAPKTIQKATAAAQPSEGSASATPTEQPEPQPIPTTTTPKPAPVVAAPSAQVSAPETVPPAQQSDTELPEPLLTDESTLAAQSAEQEPETIIFIEKISGVQDVNVLGTATPNERYVFSENFDTGVVFSQGSATQQLIAWSDKFLWGILIALTVLLIVNIFVKIEVQHKSVLVNAIALILVVSGALYLNIHQAEALGEKVMILAATLLP